MDKVYQQTDRNPLLSQIIEIKLNQNTKNSNNMKLNSKRYNKTQQLWKSRGKAHEDSDLASAEIDDLATIGGACGGSEDMAGECVLSSVLGCDSGYV